MTTMAPMGIVCLMVIAFVYEYSGLRKKIQKNVNRKRGEKARLFSELRDKYVSYMFYLTYLVLPSVTSTIFQMFICTNVDPEKEDQSDSDFYLTADMSISCSSDYYYHGVTYAAIMILVYPIGVPTMYFMLLHQNKKGIKDREKPREANTVEMLDAGDDEHNSVASNPMHGVELRDGTYTDGENRLEKEKMKSMHTELDDSSVSAPIPSAPPLDASDSPSPGRHRRTSVSDHTDISVVTVAPEPTPADEAAHVSAKVARISFLWVSCLISVVLL